MTEGGGGWGKVRNTIVWISREGKELFSWWSNNNNYYYLRVIYHLS